MKKFEWKTVKQRIGKGKKKIIAVTVVLCLVTAAAGGVTSKKNKSNASDNKAISTNVRTGTIKESVSGTGTISYASTTDIEIPSELEIDEVMVSEGSYVEQGALLATVDETSLAVCIADVEAEIESLDSTISSELSSTTTRYITAGVSGTVEKIYGEVGDDVADVMVEYGALMLVKNGDETIKIVGSDGTITAVNVSEGGTVSASSKVLTLESDAQSGDYLQAVKDREELVSILETLLSIRKNGGITASIEGMVETVNVTGTAKESSSDSKDSASVEENESLTSSDSASVEGTEPVASSDEVHKITAVTMTNLSSVSVSEFGTTATTVTTDKMKVLEELKAGAGRIEGTTKDMEYADSLEAEEWTECTDEYTEVNTGKWYVRYKATESEAASEAVEIEVTEKASAGSESSTVAESSDNSSDNSSGSGSSSGKSGSSDSSTDGSSSSGTGSSNSDSSSNSGSSNSNSTSGKGGSSSNTGSVSDSSDSSSNSGSSNSNSSDSSSDSNSSGSSSSSGKSNISGSNSSNNNSSASGSSSGKNGTSSGSGSSSGKSNTSSGSVSSSGKTSGSSGSSSGGASSSGSSLVSTTAAFTIANGDKMKVTVNVDELDILTMEEGLPAEITLDAVENKTFTGTITNVSGSASGSNGSTQYPVEITFDRTEEMLSGMNASVAVIIEEAADVLIVPLTAVTDEGRTSYVYTSYDEATGELSGKTEVTLGMSDENSVEVKEGLSEGDTVYYEMQGSDSSGSNKSGRSGMGGMGIPGMGSSSDMKMGGDRPSGSNGGDRPTGSGNGDRPSGGNGGARSSGSSGSKSKGN